MTSLAQPIAQANISAPNNISASPPAKSVLSRCIEDLSPDKVTTFDRQSKAWLVLGAITLIAFTVLAVAVFVTAGLLAPVYVPMLGIAIILSAMPVASLAKNFFEYSTNSFKEANKYSTIQEYNEILSKNVPAQTRVELMHRGINWLEIPGMQASQPQNVAMLNPLLAQAKYFDDVIQHHLETKDKLAADANQLAIANLPENRKDIYNWRNAALFSEQKAFEAKIQGAFINAVLRKPACKDTLDDIATLSDIKYHERLLGNAIPGSTGVNEFLTFKNRSLSPITYHEVKTMTVSQLGQRIAAAIV